MPDVGGWLVSFEAVASNVRSRAYSSGFVSPESNTKDDPGSCSPRGGGGWPLSRLKDSGWKGTKSRHIYQQILSPDFSLPWRLTCFACFSCDWSGPLRSQPFPLSHGIPVTYTGAAPPYPWTVVFESIVIRCSTTQHYTSRRILPPFFLGPLIQTPQHGYVEQRDVVTYPSPSHILICWVVGSIPE